MHLTNEKRVEGLDGLRAIAIGFVVLGHGSAGPGVPNGFAPARWLLSVTDISGWGVRLFFVVSGFIITHLLLVEEKNAGLISLPRFWMRRALRILPPLAGYMLAVFAFSTWVPSIHPRPIEYWMAATFTWDLLSSHGSWFLGHTWSLSIEEQFYLVWPCVFIAARSRRLQILGIAFWIILPVMTIVTQGFWPERSAWLLPANGCYLAAGCALAMLRHGNHPLLARCRELPTWRVFALVASLMLFPLLLLRFSSRMAPFTPIPGAAGIALLLHRCIDDQGLLKRLLQFKPIVAVGALSYSLYLWQQLCLGEYGTEWWQTFPQNLVCLSLAATLSHLLLEKPFLGLRHKFRHPPSEVP